MPLIKEHIIQRVQDDADIVSVAQQLGLDLKKAGANYKAKSPWQDEKTPSCMISPSKQIFKDFSSGKGGRAINLVMGVKGIQWIDAIKYLADMQGVQLEFEEETEEEEQQRASRDQMITMMDKAAQWYSQQFWKLSDAHPAKVYAIERFSEEDLVKWGVGYAPAEWENLTKSAKETGNLDLLIQCGLVKRKDNKEAGKPYDFFRDRLMFPISDARGRVVSFAGRIYPGGDHKDGSPKYINGIDTEIYDKSRVLYGMDQAATGIRKHGHAILIEGYTDVMALHSGEITNAVAACGTSLTEQHLKLLKRYTNAVTLLGDGDPAGLKSMERSMIMALKEGLKVDVIELPKGEDPYSFLTEDQPQMKVVTN